tara:strand:+ start:793 stop:1287 length:495 start_codon:yes stop_codon:yes gene_type:complete
MAEISLPISDGPKPTAFELYDFFQRQCRFEQTTLWVRFGVMVASQGALVGFYIDELGGSHPLKAVFLAIAGFTFAILLKIVQGRTMKWIDIYMDYLEELEPMALGKFEMNRIARLHEYKGDPINSTRRINSITNNLVIAAWMVFLFLAFSQYFFVIPGLTNAVT